MILPRIHIPERPVNLNQSGSDASAVLDLLPELIWMMRADGSSQYFNKAWSDYTGAPAVEQSVEDWHHWVHPHDRRQVLSRWRRSSLSYRPFADECRLQHKSGEYRWFLVQIRAQQNDHGELIRWVGTCTDIHEQRIHRNTLQEYTRVQREMLDASIDCIKVIYPNGALSTMNRAGCLALGVSEDSGFGMEWLALLPPEVRVSGGEALELARRGETARFAGMSQLPGHRPQYWDNLLTPLKDTAGSTKTILCVSREVTSQREVEIRLRDSEERLRLALESGNIGVCDADLVTGHTHCDARAKSAFGLQSPAGVTLQRLISAVHQEDHRRVTALMEDALDPTGLGEFHAEFRVIGIDDKICRYLALNGRVVFEEHDHTRFATRFSGTVLDITEKALAERELIESQNRAREVLERTTDAVVMLNSDWEFVYLNSNATQLIAGGRDLLGKNVWSEFPDALNRTFSVQFHRVLESGLSAEFEEFYPEPLNLWFEVHAYPMQNGIAVFFSDSTERRKSEEALIRSEKLAAAGRMAASVSHEINNPLEAVTNLLYLVDMDTTLSQTGRGYLSGAQAELARVSQIAIQSLQFYRQSTSVSEVMLEGQLDLILGFYRPRLYSASITILKRYRHHAPVVAFEGELRHVFTNIIGNAIDALVMSGRLFVRTRLISEKILGQAFVIVTIADTGIGMSQATMASSFEPFFSTKGITGTGLGLWVSKGIVEKHGGHIRVRSSNQAPRRGSAFMVWIPLQPTQTS